METIPFEPSIQTDFQAANSYSSIRNLPLKYNNNLNPPAGSQVQCRFCPPTLSESQMLFPMECWQLPGSKLRNDMISCHDCCRIEWLRLIENPSASKPLILEVARCKKKSPSSQSNNNEQFHLSPYVKVHVSCNAMQ